MTAVAVSVHFAALDDPLIIHGIRVLAIIAGTLAIYYAIKRMLPHALELSMVGARKRDLSREEAQKAETLAGVLVHAAAAVIFVMAAFMVFSELGVDVAPLAAGAGVAGLAIGFGAQNLVKDVISGLFVLVENQYAKGDVVCVAGQCGLVEDFNLRRTVLRDLDGAVHFVPNGEVRVASNLSKEFARVNLNVSVAYHEDIDRAMGIINLVGESLAADPQFSDDILEAPRVLRVDELGESGIAVKILGTTRPLRQWDVAGELRRRIKKAFDQEGIEIPFPHVVVVPRTSPPVPRS